MIKLNREQSAELFWLGYYSNYIDMKLFEELQWNFLNKKEPEGDIVKLFGYRVKEIISEQETPISILFSGGIDSTFMLLMALECFESKDIKAITIGFAESEFDESYQASQICNTLGLDHYICKITSSSVMETLSAINEKNLKSLFLSSSLVPTYKAMEFGSEFGATILTGDGGDELFCGYDRTLAIKRIASLPKFYKKFFRYGLIKSKSERMRKLKETLEIGYEGTVRIWPKDMVRDLVGLEPVGIVFDFFHSLVSGLDSLSIEEKYMLLDIATELYGVEVPKVEMASRLVISSPVVSPFLDYDIMLEACQLPLEYKLRGNTRKWLLRESIKRRLPDLKFGGKKGFAVPIGNWFREELKDLAESYLIQQADFFLKQEAVEQVWKEHLKGIDHTQRIWSLLLWRFLLDKGILELEE